MSVFSSRQLDNFQKTAASLKLFSRAELNDDKDRTLIEKLYVDPLPNDQVLKTLISSGTTILIGRKGTGKSTIFQRMQHEIRKNKIGAISSYMDIRNVFESSQIDPVTVDKIKSMGEAMSPDDVQKFLLHKRFISTLIADLRNELKAQVQQNLLSRLKDRVTGTSAEVFEGLDAIIASMKDANFEQITGLVQLKTKSSDSQKDKQKGALEGEISVSETGGKISTKASIASEVDVDQSQESEYTRVMMRVIGINDIIDQLREILAALGLKYIYIILDDFSELPADAMQVLVDTVVSPLSRWSDFIKFKIAAYPGRVYLGSIDKTKVEEINLDIYGLYGAGGVASMEDKAIDFVQRVVERRISHFCKMDPSVYLDTKNADLFRILFYSSMANPRILGHILLYAYESNLLYGRKIGVRAIQDASQKYFEDKVQPFFMGGKFKMAFEERSSVFSLKELLESIVNRARNIRQRGSRDSGAGQARPYSSHFYVAQGYEDLLRTLELTFFLTKYFEQSDRTGTRVSIYALNYGLCAKYQIGFGRPTERREDRLYFVDRSFDFNSVLMAYINSNQEIKCTDCGKEYEISNLHAISMFDMQCPTCKTGRCRVVNLSRKYGDIIDSIRPDLLLPDTEIGILQTLRSENREMIASEIAGELDCSGQLVGRRAKNLSERALIRRHQQGSSAGYRYELTEQARQAYFSDPGGDSLNVDE